MGSEENKGKKYAMLGIKVLGIIFIVIIALYIIRILNEETCGRTTYTDYGFGSLEPAITLDAAGETILQHNNYYIGKVKTNNFMFCFTANSTTGSELQIVDGSFNVLADVFIDTGFENHCYNINFPENASKNYIGVRCNTCSPAGKKVTVYQETLGIQTERVFIDGTFSVTEEKVMDFVLYGYNSCWNNIKYFSVWYITGVIMLMIIWLFMVGITKAEEVLFKE